MTIFTQTELAAIQILVLQASTATILVITKLELQEYQNTAFQLSTKNAHKYKLNYSKTERKKKKEEANFSHWFNFNKYFPQAGFQISFQSMLDYLTISNQGVSELTSGAVSFRTFKDLVGKQEKILSEIPGGWHHHMEHSKKNLGKWHTEKQGSSFCVLDSGWHSGTICWNNILCDRLSGTEQRW